MTRSRKYTPSAGDAWRASSPDGLVYFQVAGGEVSRPFRAAFVRPLPGVYKVALGRKALSALTGGRAQFIIRYPAEQFANILRFSFDGNFDLPARFLYPRPMRTTMLNRTVSKIRDSDGQKLSPEEYLRKHLGADLEEVGLPLLPMHGLLINMARAAWTPRLQDDDPNWLNKLLHGTASGRGQALGVSTSYFQTFASRNHASAAAPAANRALEDHVLSVAEPVDLGDMWSLTLTVSGIPSADDQAILSELAADDGGTYDGNEVGPLR
jgi:hypothetical protein